MKKSYCVCYDTLHIFINKEYAISFFTGAYYCSEGSERERYANILADLHYSNIGIDDEENEINKIYYHNENNEIYKKENILWTDYKEIIKKIEGVE